VKEFDVLFTISIILIVGGILMQFIKQNRLFGLRTPATLADPDIWEKSNKIIGKIAAITGMFIFLLNFWAYYYGWGLWFNKLGEILLLLAAVGIIIFSLVYGERLKREKNIAGKIAHPIAPKSTVYAAAVISFLFVILGIITLFVPPNSYIGIRIIKILSNPTLWKEVNTISGIGFIILGLIFAFLFIRIAKEEDLERTRLFENNFNLFIIVTFTLTAALIGFAYLL